MTNRVGEKREVSPAGTSNGDTFCSIVDVPPCDVSTGSLIKTQDTRCWRGSRRRLCAYRDRRRIYLPLSPTSISKLSTPAAFGTHKGAPYPTSPVTVLPVIDAVGAGFRRCPMASLGLLPSRVQGDGRSRRVERVGRISSCSPPRGHAFYPVRDGLTGVV